MAYGLGGVVAHQSIHCVVATDQYNIIIPKICYSIDVRVRGTASARAYLKRDPNVVTPVYADELIDDGDYITISASNPLRFERIHFIDTYVLWVSAAAGTYIEVVYITGF